MRLLRISPAPLTRLVFAAVATTACAAGFWSASTSAEVPKTAAELFTTDKVWTLHLKFSAEQWEAMEPKGGRDFGGPGGGPGRGPGGPGGFNPANFIAPVFLKGDTDKDGQLSNEEFTGLAERWFTEWDKEGKGQITSDQMRTGMNASFAGPGGGGPGGPGGGPGGPPLLGGNGARNGVAGAMGINFEYVQADLEFEGEPLEDVAVRYKGNGTFMQSRGQLKRSLKIDLNKFTKKQDLAGVTTLNLHSSVTDASWMNEVLAHRLYREAGIPAPRTAYAKLFLTVPGKYDKQYVGLYSLVENVDSNFAEDRFGKKHGAIFKPSGRGLFTDLGDKWSDYAKVYDPKDSPKAEEAEKVIEFSKIVSHGTDEEFAAKVAEYVDLNEVANYLAVTVWISTMDSILMMNQNYYLYLDRKTKRFQLLPWDLDHAFGQFMMGGDSTNLSIQQPWRGQQKFLERLFSVPAFKETYLARMKELSETLSTPERLKQQVDELAPKIRAAIAEESEQKLVRFDKAVAGEALEGFGPPRSENRPGESGPGENAPRDGAPGPGGPGGGRGFGGMGRTNPIKAFAVLRAKSVEDQLTGKLVASANEGQGPGGRGRGGFGPGMFLATPFMNALDADKDGSLRHDEFVAGFAGWFSRWNESGTGKLTEDELKKGIAKDLAPPPPGMGAPR